MTRRPRRSTGTDPLFPNTPLFRSGSASARLRIRPGAKPGTRQSAAEPAQRDHARPGVGAAHIHPAAGRDGAPRSEEHTSELQSLMRISYAVFCLKKKNIYSDIMTKHHTVQPEYTNTHLK